MKKAIRNYLAKLQENEKKGFSLVELIIVMAIMAILVGVVASQVIPYMEKSRQSKDQQVLSALLTDINSAIAQSGEKCNGTTTAVTLPNLASATNSKTVAEFLELRPQYSSIDSAAADLQGAMKSKAAQNTSIYVSVDATTGETIVFANNGSGMPSNSKMVARTNEK